MKPEIYKEEGYKLLGAAFEVYNDRGYGLGEEFYQECFEIELELRGIPFTAKQELRCFYRAANSRSVIPDLFVFNCLVVELKAVSQLLPEHEAQLINYLRITKQPVGYLVNFASKGGWEWKRIPLSEFIPPQAKN